MTRHRQRDEVTGHWRREGGGRACEDENYKDETSTWRRASRTRHHQGELQGRDFDMGVIYKDKTSLRGTSRTRARGDMDVSTWGREPHKDVRTRGRGIYKDKTSS